MESNTLVDTLRVLVVGSPVHLDRITFALRQAEHAVMPVSSLGEASEALLIQRFDAVLVGSGVPATDIAAFTANMREMDRRSGSETRTAVLSVIPDLPGVQSTVAAGALDGFVSEAIDPEGLTLAIARLATAVAADHSGFTGIGESDLPILEIEQLKEQVVFDDELLVELINLFLSERLRQSIEMKEALRVGDYELLSRIAHTIKGSLGSLHAMMAKENAQRLELSAKNREAENSEQLLAALERDLDILEGHLVAVRDSVKPS